MEPVLATCIVRLKQFCDRHIRVFAIVICVLAGVGAAGFLSPLAMQAVATPFDAEGADTGAAPVGYAYTFLDADGHVLGHRGPTLGERLSLSQMPAYLPAAFIAMEDRRFYAHHGIDFLGLGRAAYADLRAHRVVAGGSSITQQTAKLLLDRRERTLHRKLREWVRAEELEKSLTKTQILEVYLNRIYLGDGAYGVDTAARTYFGRSARDISLPQAAMLAALTRSPTTFSPRKDLAAAQARAARVLRAMVSTGAITPEEARGARLHPATLIPPATEARGYFLDAVAEEAARVAEQNALPAGELVVHTTLNSRLQAEGEAIVTTTLRERGARLHFSQAALVVMSHEGAIAALVGGADYAASQFNRVTQAHRQPGSAFKPFVYLAALEKGRTPWEQVTDVPVDIDGYQPANYKNESYGALRLTDALAHSVNTVAVNLAQQVGLDAVIAAAHDAGIRSQLHPNASLALGTDTVTPLELTAAYATFTRAAAPARPYMVASIARKDGQVLYTHPAPADFTAIADGVRRDMTSMLMNVVTSGTGTGARLTGREVAGKTGTSQDSRDAWFVGFSADWLAGVWVGNDDNSPMKGVTGGLVPAVMWRQVMTAAQAGLPATPLDKSTPPVEVPPEVVTAVSDSTFINPTGTPVATDALPQLASAETAQPAPAPQAPPPDTAPAAAPSEPLVTR